MKNEMFPITLIVLASLLLASCRGTATPSAATPVAPAATQRPTATPVPPATPAPPEKVTLTYLVSQGWLSDAEQELGQKFEEQTGIHIDYQVVPADQYFTVLRTKLNTGEGPDIFGGQSGKTDLRVQYSIAL